MGFNAILEQLSVVEVDLLAALEACKKSKAKQRAREARAERVTKIFGTIWMPLSGYPWIYGQGAGGADEDSRSRWGGTR